MLEILPLKDTTAYMEKIGELGLAANDAIVLEATECGQALGSCIFTLTEGSLHLRDVDCEDDSLYDGLVRAALSYALQQGVDHALLLAEDAGRLQRLGFVQAVDETGVQSIPSIDKFLTVCKNCKKH